MSYKVRGDMQRWFGKEVKPGTKEFGEYMNAAAEAGRRRWKAQEAAGPPFRSVHVYPMKWYHFSQECIICRASVWAKGWFIEFVDNSGWNYQICNRVCRDCGVSQDLVTKLFVGTLHLPPHIHTIADFLSTEMSAPEVDEWRDAALERRKKNSPY